MSLAARLDAADGVMDGRYFGRPIVEAGARPYYGGYGGYRTSTAAALDAADGVIDGRYFGRPIVETAGLSTAGLSRSLVRGGYYGNRYYGGSVLRGGYYGNRYYGGSVLRGGSYGGGYYGSGSITRAYGTRYAPSYVGGGYRTSTAAALDAADGVIDGRYFGRPIVETAPTYSAYGGGYAGYPVTRRLGASVTRYGGVYPAVAGGYRTSTAAALDAADGVIDGRYFGRPIVETGAYSAPVTAYSAPATAYATPATAYSTGRILGGTYGGTYGGYRTGSLAERLDAADGVMDGRYYGRPIVQV